MTSGLHTDHANETSNEPIVCFVIIAPLFVRDYNGRVHSRVTGLVQKLPPHPTTCRFAQASDGWLCELGMREMLTRTPGIQFDIRRETFVLQIRERHNWRTRVDLERNSAILDDARYSIASARSAV